MDLHIESDALLFGAKTANCVQLFIHPINIYKCQLYVEHYSKQRGKINKLVSEERAAAGAMLVWVARTTSWGPW